MRSIAALAVLVLAVLAPAPPTAAQEKAPSGEADPVAEMQAQMAKHTALTEQHEKLRYFLGDWDVTMTLVMPGAPEQSWKGTAKVSWLIDGRWLGHRLEGNLFGAPYQAFFVHGWDSYAKNWVTSSVSSMDNSLVVTRGVAVDPEDKVRTEYGHLHEYLTGELHKPLKTITRILGPDRYAVEVWDLGIGEAGAPVLKFAYARTK